MGKEDKNSRKASETAKGCLILLVLSTAIWLLIPDCSGEEEVETLDSKPSETTLKVEAYNFSHDLIKPYLKSPSTAVFPKPWNIKLLSLGNGRYFVDGYVDSQNGFGAMIRTKFECWIVYQRNVTIQIENIDFK